MEMTTRLGSYTAPKSGAISASEYDDIHDRSVTMPDRRALSGISAVQKETGGGSPGAAARPKGPMKTLPYFRLASVRSDESLTTNVEAHQLEPTPVGLIAEKLPLNPAV